MTDNVHFLGQKPVALGEPNETLIKMLEDMLAKAKTGELQTLIGVGHTSDSGIINMFTAAAHQDFYLHLGAIESLKLAFVRQNDAR